MNKALTGISISISISLLLLSGILSVMLIQERNSRPIQNEATIILTTALEKAYFEGQHDVLIGDIRIQKTETGWIWIKSPWDNGQKVLYDPKDYK